MLKLNYPYKCPYCGKPIAIIKGYGWFSWLPVEIINGDEYKDSEFDKRKHKSHLLNCWKLQSKWESVKKKIVEEEKQKEKLRMQSVPK